MMEEKQEELKEANEIRKCAREKLGMPDQRTLFIQGKNNNKKKQNKNARRKGMINFGNGKSK